MSEIFGIFNRNGSPLENFTLQSFIRGIKSSYQNRVNLWHCDSVGLGQVYSHRLENSCIDQFPLIESGIVLSVEARLDNREEIISDCGLQLIASDMSDKELVFHAYLKWKEESPKHIFGDWAFAAWHPTVRKLFLARDHYGVSSLYYYANNQVFAFASSRNALLSLNLVPIEIDELYLAEILISSSGCHGERTIHKPIKRLPPAHYLTITPTHISSTCYWKMEEINELRLPKKEDYVEKFKELFDQAVKTRLRTGEEKNYPGPDGLKIVSTLSSGLDSTSVATTAARLLKKKGKHLTSFTSTPIYETAKYVNQDLYIGNEFELAQAIAQKSGNIDHYAILAEKISPIQAILKALSILNEPGHSACNFFWMLSLLEAAQAQGCQILLTGALGNAGTSWTGSPFSQSILFQLRHFGWRQWAKKSAKQYLPISLIEKYHNIRLTETGWWKNSSIHPNFVKRLKLFDYALNSPDSLFALPTRIPLKQRLGILLPGRAFYGSTQAELGTYYHIKQCDPTVDIRLLEFVLSIPDHIFIDSATGLDRWLIREAMKDQLPEEVRLNRKTGYQAADLVPRLRATTPEVEKTLRELMHSPATIYIDVPYLHEIWEMIKTNDTSEALRKAVTILTRGIMAGLWVNDFYNGKNIKTSSE